MARIEDGHIVETAGKRAARSASPLCVMCSWQELASSWPPSYLSISRTLQPEPVDPTACGERGPTTSSSRRTPISPISQCDAARER